MKMKMLVSLLILLLLPQKMHALQRPNFNGTWRLNVALSDYGDLQGPSSRTDIIEQHENAITESVKDIQKHQEQRYVLHFSTDGKETIFAHGTGIHVAPVTIQSISANWQGDTLILKEAITYDESDLLATYRYTLSPDKQKLKINLILGAPKPAATFIFDRVKGQ